MPLEFDEDFEELKEGETVRLHMIAGAAAGVAEHCVMFPVDTVKTTMQVAAALDPQLAAAGASTAAAAEGGSAAAAAAGSAAAVAEGAGAGGGAAAAAARVAQSAASKSAPAAARGGGGGGGGAAAGGGAAGSASPIARLAEAQRAAAAAQAARAAQAAKVAASGAATAGATAGGAAAARAAEAAGHLKEATAARAQPAPARAAAAAADLGAGRVAASVVPGAGAHVHHPAQSASAVRVAARLVAAHGVHGMFRGVGALAFGAAPAHALHFAAYEAAKRALEENAGIPQPFSTSAAGGMATCVSDAIMTPAEAVKQRMQLRIHNYRGAFHCAQSVVAREGVGALYAAYGTTLLMNVPYHGVYFATYEGLRTVLKKTSESEFDALAHCAAGGGAGMVAAAVTMPLDCAKTKLQTRGELAGGREKYVGMADTLRTIYREEGTAGLVRGIKPRVVQHSTSAAICWVTYEWVKHKLRQQGV